MNTRPAACLVGAVTVAVSALAVPPAGAAAGPRCADLARTVLAGSHVKSISSELVPATATLPAYCQVDLVPTRAVDVRVTLPLSPADSGTGGTYIGAWNGRVLNTGGGGYGGDLGDLGVPVLRGEVGSVTDTGHSSAWCDATDPKTGKANAQPACGEAGGGFVLSPSGELNTQQVDDFIDRSLHEQTVWALSLAKSYYGRAAQRNYWVGGSTGGRQGWEMAQKYGDEYDGFLLGYPAVNWNRFIIGEAWPAVVVNELLGPGGLSPAKSDAANAAAVAACDPADGVTDGVVADPRRCAFDAREVRGLTAAEAEAVDLIWDGPRDAHGNRLWGGITRGTTFEVLLPGGNTMSPLIETYVRNWLQQDPGYDWRKNLTMENFPRFFEASYRKFEKTAATDSTDLSKARRKNAKILAYTGTNDPLILPFNSYNYQQRLFRRYGVQGTRSFVRTFYFPGVGHTEPDLTGTTDARSRLLDVLEAWTEHGRAPESFGQKGPVTGTGRTICAYPDTAAAPGAGAPCTTRTSVPADLAAESTTVLDRP
ncbi:MAG: tannase/feruloyl esterase family alpha/beta hydrolase [Streptomyces sp.]|uniref:tannase/feruloyl esterase family alpha/beta hydrolase n=1 Tax=Streptomyces sp. TaxID=1931 RepID=UPI0025D78FCE|nr:tannase/feruloyl esterase family alpha/beta hydrolase [Streptomyces sp.]MBW8792770.1 tannase/feruloyl esterase family alpha/beta hydrolase [Streptomyces sp.]